MTLPHWILIHPDLTDCDLRVLLMLDQLAWREGDRDGIVHASNEEIGQRLGKSAATIKRSIPRLAALEPPLIALDRASSNSRDSIRLLYDRYGRANIAGRASNTLTAQICATPASSYQENGPVVTVEGDFNLMAQICTRASAGQICATLPLNREDVVVVVEGGVGQICATPAEVNATVETAAMLPVGPRTLPELIAWLPGFTDDSRVIARLSRDVPLWLPPFLTRFPEHSVGTFCDWVTDALIQSTDADDPLKYSRRILREWSKAGGRPGIEIKAPEPEVVAPADLPPIHPMPTLRVGRFPSKGERNAAASDARRASMARLYPKEVGDGPR